MIYFFYVKRKRHPNAWTQDEVAMFSEAQRPEGDHWPDLRGHCQRHSDGAQTGTH